MLLFNGLFPEVKVPDTKDTEIDFVSDLNLEKIAQGFLEWEVGIFVRSEAQLPRARATLHKHARNLSLMRVIWKKFTRPRSDLLYVAWTRARESLTITAINPESEFLADFST